jgi:uncharacterized protein involved in type VI secretion and phage assembly
MHTFPRAGRVSIEISGIAQPLYLQSLRCVEGVSRLYQIDVRLLTTGPALPFNEIVGATAVITVEGPKPEVIFHGLIRRCQLA